MFEDIKGYESWTKVEKINKGWSKDHKYYIETVDGNKLLLRISDASTYEQKKREYEVIGQYAAIGFPMSWAIDFGMCQGGEKVYMLLSWIEGEDLEEVLPKLSQDTQYALGREAGMILKKIHSLKVPTSELPKQTKVEKKRNQVKCYINSAVRIADDERALEFFFKHLDKIGATSPVYQHGDFHPGNLIYTPEGRIGVIDFNRWEIGDPYEEFYKLESFASGISTAYCRGQIDAYFESRVPEAFWDVLAVYVAHASLYSIKWAEQFGEEDIRNMREICVRSFQHYDYFKRCIPTWYHEI